MKIGDIWIFCGELYCGDFDIPRCVMLLMYTKISFILEKLMLMCYNKNIENH